MSLPELSDFAWAILDRLAVQGVKLTYDKVATGPRYALERLGAAVKVMKEPGHAGKMGRGYKPPVMGLVITEAGKKLLADRKASLARPESS